MNRAEKAVEVEHLVEMVGDPSAAFLIDFKQLDVARSMDLRSRLRKSDGGLRVVKNRLAKRAFADSSLGQLEESFRGQTAIAFAKGDDVVAVAKVLRDFAKETELAEVKAGVVEGRVITPAEFESLAELPSREVLVAKALYLMQYPVSGLVTALSGVLRGFVVVLEQIRQQSESKQDA